MIMIYVLLHNSLKMKNYVYVELQLALHMIGKNYMPYKKMRMKSGNMP